MTTKRELVDLRAIHRKKLKEWSDKMVQERREEIIGEVMAEAPKKTEMERVWPIKWISREDAEKIYPNPKQKVLITKGRQLGMSNTMRQMMDALPTGSIGNYTGASMMPKEKRNRLNKPVFRHIKSLEGYKDWIGLEEYPQEKPLVLAIWDHLGLTEEKRDHYGRNKQA